MQQILGFKRAKPPHAADTGVQKGGELRGIGSAKGCVPGLVLGVPIGTHTVESKNVRFYRTGRGKRMSSLFKHLCKVWLKGLLYLFEGRGLTMVNVQGSAVGS